MRLVGKLGMFTSGMPSSEVCDFAPPPFVQTCRDSRSKDLAALNCAGGRRNGVGRQRSDGRGIKIMPPTRTRSHHQTLSASSSEVADGVTRAQQPLMEIEPAADAAEVALDLEDEDEIVGMVCRDSKS
jgi:hypothetical protein